MADTVGALPVSRWEHGRLNDVRKVSVIRVKYAKGAGINGDPIRECIAYYTEGGELIGHQDPETGHES